MLYINISNLYAKRVSWRQSRAATVAAASAAMGSVLLSAAFVINLAINCRCVYVIFHNFTLMITTLFMHWFPLQVSSQERGRRIEKKEREREREKEREWNWLRALAKKANPRPRALKLQMTRNLSSLLLQITRARSTTNNENNNNGNNSGNNSCNNNGKAPLDNWRVRAAATVDARVKARVRAGPRCTVGLCPSQRRA